MTVGIQTAIEEMQRITGEYEQLKAQIDQKDRLLDELRSEMAANSKKLKDLEPYLNIVEEEPKQMYLLHITDSWVFKQLKARCKQVSGREDGAVFRHFTEAILTAALTTYWPYIRKNKFDRQDQWQKENDQSG